LTGENYFDLLDWETGSGGEWRNWFIDNGVFTSAAGLNPQCTSLSIPELSLAQIRVFPNPFVDRIQIKSDVELKTIQLIGILGNIIPVELQSDLTINLSSVSSGIYFLTLKTGSENQVFRLIKK
jgi:hypothetical protein